MHLRITVIIASNQFEQQFRQFHSSVYACVCTRVQHRLCICMCVSLCTGSQSFPPSLCAFLLCTLFEGELVIKHALRFSHSIYIWICVQLYISTVFTLPCFCFRYCTQAPTHAHTHTHAHNESSHSVIRWLNATKQSGANTRIKYVHFVYVNMFYLRPMLHFVTLHKQ